jgi:hypothetical protein
MGRVDKMIRSGRFKDLYREHKAVAPSTRLEYFMMEAGRKVGPQEIEDSTKQLGNGFPLWLAWGHIYRGWSTSALGEPEEGYALIARGLSMLRATGCVLTTAFALTLLAEACNRLGRREPELSD